jgi:hypothetical protein
MTAYIEVFCYWTDHEGDIIRLDLPDDDYPEEETLTYCVTLTTYTDDEADDRQILEMEWDTRWAAQQQAESMAGVLGIEWHDYSRDPHKHGT